MKILLLLIVYSILGVLSEADITQQWNIYKLKYIKKRILNPEEETLRRSLFEKRLQEIEEHNERYRKGLETYTMGINRFTAYTDEEISSYVNGLNPLLAEVSVNNTSDMSRFWFINFDYFYYLFKSAPDSYDWRELGKVTPVKNQGQCGSCWAFAATAAIESRYKIKHGSEVTLSEQQLVDCMYRYRIFGRGCRGGFPSDAFQYIIDNRGINYDSYYPYEMKEGSCRYNSGNPKVTISSKKVSTNNDEELMKKFLYFEGPYVVGVNAAFTSYSGGVYYNPKCSKSINHAVVIVGYGRESGQDYWLIKNSWGAEWGMDGYIKLARNRNGQCGITLSAERPVL